MDANIAEVFTAIAESVPDRECVVHGDRRLTFAEVAERSRRLANGLLDRGLRLHTERAELEAHESGQDLVALYLHNGPEYLEGMVGSWMARVAPFNVNYRYVAEELRSLLLDSGARAIVYHARFAPVLGEIRADLPRLEVLIQVADDSGADLLPGAVDYEDLLASSSPAVPTTDPSPDDLYIAYTGGTTGMPKGVLWRQADIYAAAMGGSDPSSGEEFASIDEALAAATAPRVYPYLIAAPLMHAAGQWLAFLAWSGGDPVVFPTVVEHLDVVDILRTIERERIAFIILVGNAFGRPLLDELDRGDYDLSSLNVLATGGTAMTSDVKKEFLAHRPGLRIVDSIGSSESGTQGRHVAAADTDVEAGVFFPGPGTTLLTEDLDGIVPHHSDDTGWLARTGRIPLGYLGDPAKTAATFPLLNRQRWSVPGDRARWRPDGSIQLLGRDSVCIDTGGEKVFVEEVEAALHGHPDVVDALVVGRPSERWGSEVVAVVDRGGSAVSADALVAHCDGHLARYKLPKDVVFVDEVRRGPNGKPDYRWAADVAVGGSS
mgnify:CR=1 FL=1